MGRKHDEIWQELCELDNRVTRLEELTADDNVEMPDSAPVDGLAELRAENARLLAERDALCARIEAGRVMYGGMYGHENKFEMWTFEHVYTDTMTARLIDIAPIADAGEMADERRGERRVLLPEYFTSTDFSMDYAAPWRTNRRNGDRRTVNPTGTRADRKVEA